jgi:hypothetical protein
MAVVTGLIGRALSTLFSLFGRIRGRQNAQRWVGRWEAYNLVGRDLAEPMKGAGPTDVSLPRWWTVSAKLTFECYDCDAQGEPTRSQTGYILIDPNDPCTATRVGRYLDSAEVYEQRLTMLDNDTILIIPVPERSTLGNVYAKHGWRRRR